MAEEREALAIRALLALGRGDEARERAAGFRAAYPHSFLTPVIDSALSHRELRSRVLAGRLWRVRAFGEPCVCGAGRCHALDDARSARAANCPDRTALQNAVSKRLGYDPFFPAAARRPPGPVDVAHAARSALHVRLEQVKRPSEALVARGRLGLQPIDELAEVALAEEPLRGRRGQRAENLLLPARRRTSSSAVAVGRSLRARAFCSFSKENLNESQENRFEANRGYGGGFGRDTAWRRRANLYSFRRASRWNLPEPDGRIGGDCGNDHPGTANGTAEVFIRNTNGTDHLPGCSPRERLGRVLGLEWNRGTLRGCEWDRVRRRVLVAGPFTQFSVPGASGTYPAGSNASGMVVGFWSDAANNVHGFVRSASGAITKFDVPGQAQTQPESINSSGQVAGVAYSSAGVAEGFVGAPGGTITTYSFPSGSMYGSADLNDAGQIAGYYADRNFASKGYFRNTNGTFTTLTEGGQVSVGNINQSGYIVGVMGGKYHGRKDGYLNRPNGTFATIEYPGASLIVSSTKCIDINSSGLIMGEYQQTTQSNGDTAWHGFIVSGGQ